MTKSEDSLAPNILGLSRPKEWTYTMRRHMQVINNLTQYTTVHISTKIKFCNIFCQLY